MLDREGPPFFLSIMFTADDIPKPLHRNNFQRAPRLRHPIVPGSVLILLAGRFRGKRVVFLKQMESGLLLVTAFVMPTSTKVELPQMDLSKYTDDYFKKTDIDASKIEDQKAVDSHVLAAVNKVPYLKDYLRCAFTLNNGDHPHRMRF
ncbi:hypothetical protein RCL1_005448 [Eukaryota sp. TZLM3-RCL]